MPRTFVIGDIHGCHAELLDLCDRAALAEDDEIVSVGDLVDRGPDPGTVIDFFRARPETRRAICGNHERKHVRGVLSYSQQAAKLQLGTRYDDDVRWMGALPYHLERPDLRVLHWGLYPGVPLDEVPEDVRAGTTSGDAKLRARFGATPWYAHYRYEVPVVFGHAVVGAEPLVIDDRVFGIDTGACHGMRLTGVLFPERRVVSVPAREDHWARVRAAYQVPVLRTLAWGELTFAQIDKKLRSLEGPELGADALARVAAWSEALRAAIPTLRARLDEELERLAAGAGEEALGRAAADHAAGKWLVRWRAGKLSRDHLGCATPAALIELATALGVELPREPFGG